jgi:hypothetical protein
MTSLLAMTMHSFPIPSLFVTLFGTASLLSPCSGQSPQEVDAPKFALGQVANVTFDESGAPIALGPDWEAHFEARGARFVAVLGTLTPELVDLRLAAASVRQGEVELPLLAETAPEIDGDRVRYRRAAGVVERFDATLAGLAHSVLLERPLGGRGELVVTVAFAGSVAGHGKQLADGTLLFSKGHGGVAIGALTAIDATGARGAGELRLAPGGIEWVVPAAFAERAAYPLLLDPLVGTNFVLSQPLVGTGGLFGSPYEYDGNADVAYDDSTSTWLVVWERGYWGPGTQAIRGQRFGVTGVPIGGMLSLATNTTLLLREPHVANVTGSNRFVVTWLQDTATATQVVARAVNAGDGVMSSPLTVASAALGTIEGIDIGGESSASPFAPAKAWIVWGGGANGIVGAVVTAPPNNGAVSVFQTFTVAGPPGGSTVTREPTISRMTSADGRLAVAWVRDDAVAARIRGTVIDRTGAPLYAQQILSGSDLYASAPQIDGGGDGECDFVCTWFSQSPGGIFGPPQGPPYARAGAMRAGAQLVATGPLWNLTPAYAPDVAWRAGKAYITCTIADSVVLVGLDPRTCAACESLMTVASPSPPSSSALGRVMVSPTVCMQAPSGDPAASRGVVVWTESRYTPFILGSLGAESPLYGRRVDAFATNATTSNLGGGCGGGGSLTTVGPPAVGNGTFRLELSGAGPSSLLAVLNLVSPSTPVACGACQWLPFAATVVVAAVGGAASVPVPIPCSASLAGSTIDAQWTVWQPGSAPCALAPDFALSNIRRLNLQ